MAPNQVVLIWHIRRQKSGGTKMAPNQVVSVWHIRRKGPDGAKMALAITTLTTSMTRWCRVDTFIWNLHKWMYIIFVSFISLIWLIFAPSLCYRVIHLKCPTHKIWWIKIHDFIKNRDKYMKFSEILAKTTSNIKKKLTLKKFKVDARIGHRSQEDMPVYAFPHFWKPL